MQIFANVTYKLLEMHRLQFSWLIPISDFFGSVTCRYWFLPIPIFFLRTIIGRIYKNNLRKYQLKMIYIIK